MHMHMHMKKDDLNSFVQRPWTGLDWTGPERVKHQGK